MNQQQQHQGRPTESPEKTLGDSMQESLQAAALRPRAHAAAAATLAPDAVSLSQSVSVTPSSAGDINPTPPSLAPETTGPPMLSVRPPHETAPLSHDSHHTSTAIHEPPPDIVVSPTLLYPEHGSVQTIQPSALFGRPEEQPPGSLQLGPAEFAIPLPMDSRVKDQYIRTLGRESRSIRRLLSGSDVSADADGDVVRAIRGLVERLDEICVHEDLGIAEQVAKSNPDPRKEAAWAEYVSAKFQFLGHLLEIAGAQEQELHLIVMVKRGKTQELVERYFLGKGFTYTRPREEMPLDSELSMVNGALSIGIHPTEREGLAETYRPPRAILALDSSFRASHPSTQHLRTTYARHGSLLPVVRLVIANSSEHVQRCLPEMPELQRLRVLTHVIISLRDVVGDLQDDALGVHEDAEELYTCLVADDFAASWTLPKIEPLHISIVDEPVELSASTATKRLSEAIDVDAPETKRPRYGLSEEPSQVVPDTDYRQRLKELESKLKEKEDKLKEKEDQLGQLEETHKHELAEVNERYTKAAEQIADKEKHLEDAQRRFENLVEKVRTIRKERDGLSEELRKTNARAEKQQNELTKLRDERTQLRQDLDAVRAQLKASGGLAEELEQSREKVRQLEKDNSSLKRKADSAQQQAEYTREQYQNASTAAAQTGVELRQVREENERLRRRVESDAVRLRELRARSDESRHLQRIAELESLLAAREELLRRKEEELRSLRSARPSTRATSVQPRSPKLVPGGAPGSRSASPGIGAGGNSNGNNNHYNNNSSVGRGSALRYSSEVAL